MALLPLWDWWLPWFPNLEIHPVDHFFPKSGSPDSLPTLFTILLKSVKDHKRLESPTPWHASSIIRDSQLCFWSTICGLLIPTWCASISTRQDLSLSILFWWNGQRLTKTLNIFCFIAFYLAFELQNFAWNFPFKNIFQHDQTNEANCFLDHRPCSKWDVKFSPHKTRWRGVVLWADIQCSRILHLNYPKNIFIGWPALKCLVYTIWLRPFY